MYIVDVECYSNYFLIVVKSTQTNKYKMFEMHNDKITIQEINPLQVLNLKKTLITFNGKSYDVPMITLASKKVKNRDLKDFSDMLITGTEPYWRLIKVPQVDHIDLINVIPGKASLKVYGGRLHTKTMQDLPLPPDSQITPDQLGLMREYCKNDTNITHELLTTQENQLNSRIRMNAYLHKRGFPNEDVRSKSDAQMAELVLLCDATREKKRKELVQRNEIEHDAKQSDLNHSELNNIKPIRSTHIEYITKSLRYKNPNIINFKNKTLAAVFNNMLNSKFTIDTKGAVVLPAWLKKPIELHGKLYKMGIGGLHSCEKRQVIEANENTLICDWDVTSYYPSIILQQGVFPAKLGYVFKKLYKKLLDNRLKFKAQGDTVASDTFKICVNGTFGKLGSKYSPLYAPELLIQTTITGQLALLLLIDMMVESGIDVMSANTDGIVCKCAVDKEPEMLKVVAQWQDQTTFNLERTDYKIVASRDVNNYIAVKTDNTAKGKGIFAKPNLMKNPNNTIIYKAVENYLAHDIDIEETILNAKDITDFLTVRQVTGGAIWQGQKLGKAIRFYYSDAVDTDTFIRYVKNDNKVPLTSAAKPLMVLPDAMPKDVNKDHYICMAYKLLDDIGMDDARKEHRSGFSLASEKLEGFG